MCAKFRFSISSRCGDIIAEVKGGNFMPPPAAGGWRGGPAAAGLIKSSGTDFRLNFENRSIGFLDIKGGAGSKQRTLPLVG